VRHRSKTPNKPLLGQSAVSRASKIGELGVPQAHGIARDTSRLRAYAADDTV
jgi:hypothetical protein